MNGSELYAPVVLLLAISFAVLYVEYCKVRKRIGPDTDRTDFTDDMVFGDSNSEAAAIDISAEDTIEEEDPVIMDEDDDDVILDRRIFAIPLLDVK